MKEALKSTGLLIAVVNIMNDRHTQGYDVDRHIKTINRIAGAKVVKVALFHNEEISAADRKIYAKKNETPVIVNLDKLKKVQKTDGYRAVGANLIADQLPASKNDPRDLVTRSLVRHDQEKLYRAISEIINQPAGLFWVK